VWGTVQSDLKSHPPPEPHPSRTRARPRERATEEYRGIEDPGSAWIVLEEIGDPETIFKVTTRRSPRHSRRRRSRSRERAGGLGPLPQKSERRRLCPGARSSRRKVVGLYPSSSPRYRQAGLAEALYKEEDDAKA